MHIYSRHRKWADVRFLLEAADHSRYRLHPVSTYTSFEELDVLMLVIRLANHQLEPTVTRGVTDIRNVDAGENISSN